jgi:hypothetical protein
LNPKKHLYIRFDKKNHEARIVSVLQIDIELEGIGMKRMIVILVAVGAMTTAVMAAEAGKDPVARGAELFKNAKLGTNGKTCATCHPDGTRLEEAASYGDDQLAKVINRCIEKALSGKPIPVDSDNMTSMIKYIRAVTASQGQPKQ